MIEAGTAKAKITSPLGIKMMGISGRDKECEGIHDDIYVKTLLLQQGKVEVLIIATDLLFLSRKLADRYKGAIGRHFDIYASHILINSSHTHAGPLVAKQVFWDDYPDEAYLAFLEQQILHTVNEARTRREEVRLSYGEGKTSIGINRRKIIEGIIRMAPNPQGPVDDTCSVVQVSNAKGETIALIFSVSCHPTIMHRNNYQISAEFPGVAQSITETYLGEGAISLFLQGTGGDVKPRIVGEETHFRYGEFADVEQVGKELAQVVINVLKGDLVKLSPCLEARSVELELSLQKSIGKEGFQRIVQNQKFDQYRKNWARYHLEQLERNGRISSSASCTLQCIKLSGDLRIIGLEGEVVTDIGRLIKGYYQTGHTIALGCSNGCVTYLPSKQILSEGGYEAEAYLWSSLPAPFDRGIEENILGGLEKLSI